MDHVQSSNHVLPTWSNLEALVSDQSGKEHPKIYSIAESCLAVLKQENSKSGTTREQLRTLIDNIDQISTKKAAYYKEIGVFKRVLSYFRNFVRFQQFVTSDKLADHFKMKLQRKLDVMPSVEGVVNGDKTSLDPTQEKNDPNVVEIGESEDDKNFVDAFDEIDEDGDAFVDAFDEIEEDDDAFADALTDFESEEESYDEKTKTSQEDSPRASTPDHQENVASSVSPAASAEPESLNPAETIDPINTIWKTWGKKVPFASAYIKQIWTAVFAGAEVETWEKVPDKENCYKLKLKNSVSGKSDWTGGDIHLNQEMTIQFSTEQKNGQSCPKITFMDEGIYHKKLLCKTPVESITFEPFSDSRVQCQINIPMLQSLLNAVNRFPLISKIGGEQFTSVPVDRMYEFWSAVRWKKA